MQAGVRNAIYVWVALMLLLAATFSSAYLKLGAWNSIINLAIAALKALLVAIFFMHLRTASALLRIAAATALLTLSLLFILSHADYATRAALAAPWQIPPSQNFSPQGSTTLPSPADAGEGRGGRGRGFAEHRSAPPERASHAGARPGEGGAAP